MKEAISRLISLTVEEWTWVGQFLHSRHYRKNMLVSEPGQQFDKLLYIQRGAIRSYLLRDGLDLTYSLLFEESFCADFHSLHTRQPSRFYFEAFEDTTAVVVYQQDLDQIRERIPAFERAGRILSERACMGMENRLTELLFEELETRYLHLLSTRPELFQRVPQHLIASYLGAHPQSLSRVKQQIYLREVKR